LKKCLLDDICSRNAPKIKAVFYIAGGFAHALTDCVGDDNRLFLEHRFFRRVRHPFCGEVVKQGFHLRRNVKHISRRSEYQ